MKGLKWKKSIMLYLAVWGACILWFWLGLGGGGWIMAYTILSFGVILPVMTLVAAFLLEWKQNLGYWRWAAMGFFSIMYVAALWATFVLSTSLGAANIGTPSWSAFLIGLCSSTVGITLGWLVRSRKLGVKIPAMGLALLLAVCYVWLKTLNGAFFRPVLILDIPAAAMLFILGIWFFFQKKRAKTDYK